MKKGMSGIGIIIIAIVTIFVVIILSQIGPGRILGMPKLFNFLSEDNETIKNIDIVNLKFTVNSLLIDKKSESYKIIDEFLIDEDQIMVGFDTGCIGTKKDKEGIGNSFCPITVRNAAFWDRFFKGSKDQDYRIPKPVECSSKACICYFEDSSNEDFAKGESEDNLIKGSCITFDGNIEFKGVQGDPFNFGKNIENTLYNYLVMYQNAKEKDFDVRQELYVEKFVDSANGVTQVIISSRLKSLDARIAYLDKQKLKTS